MSSVEAIKHQIEQFLERPKNEWSIEQINLYQLLEQNVIKHRRMFLQTQFNEDKKDISENIKSQSWYKSKNKTVIDEFLKQFFIAHFSLVRQTDALSMSLTISLDDAQIKLKYFNNQTKFLYYLYVEPIAIDGSETNQRGYLVYNHPKSNINQDLSIPDLDEVYRFLGRKLVKLPAGILMRLLAEIILFYEDSQQVIKTPISDKTEWSLADALN